MSSSHADLKSCTTTCPRHPPKTEILKNILGYTSVKAAFSSYFKRKPFGIGNARFILHAAILLLPSQKCQNTMSIKSNDQSISARGGGEGVEVTPNDFHKIQWKVGTSATGEEIVRFWW